MKQSLRFHCNYSSYVNLHVPCSLISKLAHEIRHQFIGGMKNNLKVEINL